MMEYISANKKHILRIALVVLYAVSLPWIANCTDSQYALLSKLRLIPYAMISLLALFTLLEGIKKKGSLLQYIKDHLVLIVCCIVALCIFIASHNIQPIVFVIMLVALSDEGFEEFLKPILLTHIAFMILTIVLSKMGIIEQVVIGRNNSDVIRQSLGYMYPLELHGHFFIIVLMYILFRKEKYTWSECLGINGLNIVLFQFSDARTDVIMVFVVSVLALLLQYIKTDWLINKKMLWLYAIGTIAFVVIPFIMTIAFNPTNEFEATLNRALSNRLYITNYVIEEEGLPIFGKEMEWVGFGRTGTNIEETYNWVDFSFIKDTIDYGLVFTGIFTCGWIYMFYDQIKKRSKYGILVVMVLLLSCIIEYRSFLPHIYPLILLMAPAIMVENKDILKIKVEDE